MAFYAWTPIRHATADGKETVIARGAKVVKADLPGITDADWQQHIDSGAFRDRPIPSPEDYRGSVIDWYRESLREAQSISPVDEEEARGELADIMQAEKMAKTGT